MDIDSDDVLIFLTLHVYVNKKHHEIHPFRLFEEKLQPNEARDLSLFLDPKNLFRLRRCQGLSYH
jgi:hypothetical protein